MGADRESFLRRWQRRAVTFPLILVGAGLVLSLLPLLLGVAVAIDLVKRSRFAWVRALAFVVVYFVWEIWGVTCLWAIWLGTAFGLASGLFGRANARLQALWGTSIYWVFEFIYGLRTEVHGEVPPPGAGPLIVFFRHSSSADTVLPLWLLAYPRGYRLRYVLKAELLFDPCIDICGQRLPNCFVRRGKGDAAAEVARITALLPGITSTDAVVIYPEGTRFTPEKRARAIERLEQRGPAAALALSLSRSLTRSLSPLRAGPLALLEHNEGAHLVVVSHTGLEAVGSFRDLTRGGLIGKTVHLHVATVPFSEIPRDPTGQAELVARLWTFVDQFIIQHSIEPAPEERGSR
jgi:1-acyl-sn-glycerol-3-phosphate acyltransferase